MKETVINVALSQQDWRRDVAGEARIPLLNRYYEADPLATDGGAALIARPGLTSWKTGLAAGPIRGIYSQVGVFNNALFVVSDTTLFRIDTNETVTTVGSGLAGSPNGTVSMVATDSLLFLADGTNLWLYTDNGTARGTLTITGAISSGEKVQVGSLWYQFTSGSVDAGTPAGTSTNPYLVAVGTTPAIALDNLSAAIENSGTAGTDYSTGLQASTEVDVGSVAATTLKVSAQLAGSAGNSLATTETLANGSWGATTLTGGGTTQFTTVTVPNSLGAVWVDVIDSFVLVVVAQTAGYNGRFYWIQPGEQTIDALNFATAERAPDPLYHCMTQGDMFWLFGSDSTEPWYLTGDGLAPFQRTSGRTFDHGVWQGTPIRVKDGVMVVDNDGAVWMIGTSQWNYQTGMQRVSNPGIEEQIRLAIRDSIVNGT